MRMKRQRDLEREEKQKMKKLRVSKETQDALLNLVKDKHSILISWGSH